MPLPNFVIVGAQRCGTTAMTGMLRAHPSVHMPGGEVHFFDRHWGKGVEWYRSQFKEGKVNGEKTPRYLAEPVALLHLKRTVPDVKVIVLMRDPVLRFASACRHWNKIKKFKKYRGVHQFVKTRAGIDALWRGVYLPQLVLLESLFERVQIVFNEHLREDTENQMNRVQQFIGVAPITLTNDAPAERVFPSEPLEKEIREWYQPHNHLLSERLQDCHTPSWVNGEKDIKPAKQFLSESQPTDPSSESKLVYSEEGTPLGSCGPDPT